jgi:signal transduction histidine kinase
LQDLANLPAVMGGKQSLTLVFANLIENAATAMDGQGEIVIRGAAYNSWVRLDVIDDGPGIVPELHDRIFEFNYSGRKSRNTVQAAESAENLDHRESLVRANAPRAPTVQGKLGFGLWWVRTLMMRLGGSVAVESDGRRGTRFILRLPRAGVSP